MDDRHGRHRRAPIDAHRRPPDGYRTGSTRRFGRLVDDALDALPSELEELLDDVELVVEEVPPRPRDADDAVILGTYIGSVDVPAPAASPAPDRLVLYRRPIEARAGGRVQLARLIREVVVRELAAHHGIDDDRLDELGW